MKNYHINYKKSEGAYIMKKMCYVLLIALLISFQFSVFANDGTQTNLPLRNNIDQTSVTDETTLTAYPFESNISKVMIGESGTILLVDSICDKEYAEMMSIIYPNGIVDDQGLDIPGINEIKEVREKFVSEHMKAYSLVDGKTIEVELIPFKIDILDSSNGEYESLFYQASVGESNFIFPSEWGNQSFGFISASEKDIYIAFTDMGIWSIDSTSMKAQKISSDTYFGKTISEVNLIVEKLNQDAYLTWIDSVHISPDGNYVVYRTNRDCTMLNQTTVWTINLKSGEESQLISSAYNNDIVGFITDRNLVVGALGDTRAVDTVNRAVINLDTPNLPNIRIGSVKDGKIIFYSYEDGSSNSTVYISDVDISSGKIADGIKVTGYLDGEPQFSSSGKKVAIGYGNDAMKGVEDVVVVDLISKSQTLLTESLQNSQTVNGNIIRFRWIDDNMLHIDAQMGSDFSNYMIETTNIE